MNYEHLKLLVAIFLPPVGVFMATGLSFQLLLNVILTVFGYLPGIIHAFWVILRDREASQPI